MSARGDSGERLDVSASGREAFDRNLLEAIREFGRWQSGSLLLEEDGVVLLSGGTDFPGGFSNCVVRTDSATDPEVVLERAEGFFRPQGRGFAVWVRDQVDEDIEARLRERGLRPRGDAPWMVLQERAAVGELPTGIECQITSDPEDLPAIRRILGASFGPSGTPIEEIESIFSDARHVFSPVTRVALATLDGQPAATAMALRAGGMAGIYWVGTKPEHARRGLGRICTATVANAALDLGESMVGLFATAAGLPLYQRMGFSQCSMGHRWYLAT